jgi:hypothetical protein
MDNCQDRYPIAFKPVKEPIAVNEALTDRLISKLRHDAPRAWKDLEAAGNVNSLIYNGSGAELSITSYAVCQALHILHRCTRPLYFVVHFLSRLSTSSCVSVPWVSTD